MALLGPTRLLIFEKSATYMIKWSYTIIWQVTVHQIVPMIMDSPLNHLVCICIYIASFRTLRHCLFYFETSLLVGTFSAASYSQTALAGIGSFCTYRVDRQ